MNVGDKVLVDGKETEITATATDNGGAYCEFKVYVTTPVNKLEIVKKDHEYVSVLAADIDSKPVQLEAKLTDKIKSIKGWYRISERVLLVLSLLGGCFGMFVGMKLFRHKTKKNKFKLVYLFCFLYLVLFLYLYVKYIWFNLLIKLILLY